MAEFRTTIDYPAQTLTFSTLDTTGSVPSGATRVPFYSDGHCINVEAEVDGHRGLFRLDTGDGSTVTLFPDFAKANNLYQTGGESGVSGGGMGGNVTARHVTLSRFRLAGIDFNDLPARVSLNKSGSFASRSLAGNLGGGVLRCFRITIDYGTRSLLFESDPERLKNCAH
jgi:hypothetical protein